VALDASTSLRRRTTSAFFRIVGIFHASAVRELRQPGQVQELRKVCQSTR
jgi:hypothetical protein